MATEKAKNAASASAALKAAMEKAAALRKSKQAELEPAVQEETQEVIQETAQEPNVEEPEPDVEEPALLFRCHGCGRGFASSEELGSHVLKNAAACSGPAWQAAANAIGCMPGAGTTLWCPACPDDFIGKWTGSITKAAALLRHASCPNNAPEAHAWFLKALTDLILAEPPAPGPPPVAVTPENEATEAAGGSTSSVAQEFVSAEDGASQSLRLQDWISSSPPVMGVVGPLLAKPGPAAREAAREELETSLSSRGCAIGKAPLPFGAEARGQDEDDSPAKKRKKKVKKDDVEGPAYDFYNQDIPMDVFLEAQDPTHRTADGVPVLDLLDSDEEAEEQKAEDITEL